MSSGFKNELKAQGAIEAAQDPDTTVTADDAQRVVLNESKKAGSTALHFDPNASPEEKAAQAGARVNDTARPPKGVGIATDLDDGKPDQYDLPPPEPLAVATSGQPLGDPKAGANGAPAEEQEEDWTKVGWAPRFGSGETEADKDAGNLLDHQTFLEGKLDEKLYGDWYHNTAVIVFACLASWLAAVLGGGLGWILIIMATCGSYYRTSIRRVRRNFRDDITRELAKARLETDTESLEWMNSFLVKFWPIYAPQLAKAVIQSVDQVLSTSTPAFLDSMRLESFILGTKPPRMEHVKTYPKSEDDIVMMDWKFSFTPTDTMDMTVRQLKTKINPKVVLEIRVGKGVVSKAMKIIVEDFEFSGLMRVRMKLQIPFPHIDRVDICFLERPTIDYVCKPIGGETFGFDINFIPGLESFIKEQIHGNLAPMMYAPNVFPIEVAKMLSGNPMDLAVGVVAVTVYNGHSLKNPDKFSGTPDPYVVVSLNSSKELARTKTIHEDANPRWNETLYIIITNFTDALTLQVYDYNDVRKDKHLGTATFALDQLESVSEHEGLSLDVLANGKHRGVVQADVRFFPILEPEKLPNGEIIPPPESNTGIARITIEQAKDLDGSKSMVGSLDPYAVLLLNGKEAHITNKLKHTNNPVFSDNTKSVLITDRKKARVGLVIKDSRGLSTDPVIGSYQIKLDDLLKSVDKGQEWYNLHGTKSGKVKLMLDWKPVPLKGISGSDGYITPIGVLRVHAQSAHNLRNFETLGKSDPYARVLLSGIPKGRTVTFQNDLNPEWDEVIYVPMHSPSEGLILEVMDEEKLGKDRSLGLVQISASDYIKESDEGGYEIHDTKTVISSGLRMGGIGEAKGTINYTVSFFPTLNVVDPEDEEEERNAQAAVDPPGTPIGAPSASSKASIDAKSLVDTPRASTDVRASLDTAAKVGAQANGTPSTNGSIVTVPVKQAPKIRLNPEHLGKYESGLLVFHLVEGHFSMTDVHLEVVMDDHAFPAYSSSKIRQRDHHFGETADAMVREIEMSRITLRLTEKADKTGKQDEEDVVAKLTGSTLTTLQQCLYKPTELTLRSNNGGINKVVVVLKYLPVKMQLDPSESINNMGTLRVDVLDAADLPSADRNGYSDPYCRFRLDGKEVYKTKIQKKTLHPAWNEFFEVAIPSRTAADFKVDVYDWDFGDKADHLGSAPIDLRSLEPFQPQEVHYTLNGKSGVIRLKMMFKPDYITRARHGASTFSGTFAPAGKVIGAPVKGVGKVGGGVVKGASFIKRGLTGRGSKDESTVSVNAVDATDGRPGTPVTTPAKLPSLVDGTASPATPSNLTLTRTRSNRSSVTNNPKGGETGTASFILVSATGYPPGADVRVHVKMMGSRGGKELFKTKAVKSSSGSVEFDTSHENFKVSCSADTQFQIVVKDHDTFRSRDLGEGLFFVSDQGGGSEQSIKVGHGTVTLRSTFTPNDAGVADSLKPTSSGRDSPESKREGRRSFFGRREASGRHDAQ